MLLVLLLVVLLVPWLLPPGPDLQAVLPAWLLRAVSTDVKVQAALNAPAPAQCAMCCATLLLQALRARRVQCTWRAPRACGQCRGSAGHGGGHDACSCSSEQRLWLSWPWLALPAALLRHALLPCSVSLVQRPKVQLRAGRILLRLLPRLEWSEGELGATRGTCLGLLLLLA